MYEDHEISISRRYLERIIQVIEEPIALLGGWAVYLKVNDPFKMANGREYLGSRDIDLGFHVGKTSRNRTLENVYRVLTEELGFEQLSFRLFKQVDVETGLELDEETARKKPSYEIFPMYIDMIMDQVPEDFRERFGFHPVDEALLRIMFGEEKERTEITFMGKKVLLPSTNILLSMKTRSYPNRDKEHKKIKDLCDISSLLAFTSDWDGSSVLRLAGSEQMEIFVGTIDKDEFGEVSRFLGLGTDVIDNAMKKFLGQMK